MKRLTSSVIVAIVTAISPAMAAAQAPAAATHAAPAPGGPREGITVHGDWTIEVRNPDGTLVRRQEFKNALIPDAGHLPSLLARTGFVGYWRLTVFDRTNSPCQGGTHPFFPNECYVVENAGNFANGTNVFRTLTVTTAGVNGQQLVITGTATALTNGQISEVQSNFGVCTSSPCPATGLALPFTGANLSAPVPVVAGQIIQVTFTVTFS